MNSIFCQKYILVKLV